jgi:hypothetical protein
MSCGKIEEFSYKYLKVFKVWTCFEKIATHDPKKIKIKPKNMNYIFIGYDYNNNVY